MRNTWGCLSRAAVGHLCEFEGFETGHHSWCVYSESKIWLSGSFCTQKVHLLQLSSLGSTCWICLFYHGHPQLWSETCSSNENQGSLSLPKTLLNDPWELCLAFWSRLSSSASWFLQVLSQQNLPLNPDQMEHRKKRKTLVLISATFKKEVVPLQSFPCLF